ncbi:MAG: DUF5685 family protein [Acidobacteriota bacterium]|nr:DUF5685 family protein [Acidobacteriota bacterium]
MALANKSPSRSCGNIGTLFGLNHFRGAMGSPERRLWQLHYCGTCKTMGRQYGHKSRPMLNHDAVFLAELLTQLAGEDVEAWGGAYQSRNCVRLPGKEEMPVVLRYAAAANVLLSEYKLNDRQIDSPGKGWTYVRKMFSRSFRSARKDLAAWEFPLAQCDRILSRQGQLECSLSDVEQVAGPTAEATAIVFRHGARLMGLNAKAEELAGIGHRFGNIVYVLDAWEDFDQDAQSGAFNALQSSGVGRAWAESYIRKEAGQLEVSLEHLGVPAAARLRLGANIEARLGRRFSILQSCGKRDGKNGATRWRQAMAKTRALKPTPWAFAGVLSMAFLFPLHARTVRSSSECLSLGFNLMALGGLFASAVVDGDPEKKPATSKSCMSGGFGDCCGESCGDGCCEGCCSCDC